VEQATAGDAARTAAILGFFGAGWFGWGGSEATDAVGTALGVGGGIAVVVTLAGVWLSWRTRHGPSAIADDPAGRRRYGIVVGIEVVACAVGAFALGLTGAPEWIPVWICAVVGAHFFPLVSALHDPWLRPLGAAMLLVAAAGAVTEAATDVAASTVVGAGAGVALTVYAAAKLARAAGGLDGRDLDSRDLNSRDPGHV
jgi:hypothetical protein